MSRRRRRRLQRAVEREIKILKKLRHHHVTVLHDSFSSPNRVWAVLEFVSGGELTHFIMMDGVEWSEPLAIRCAFQVWRATCRLSPPAACSRCRLQPLAACRRCCWLTLPADSAG